MHKSWIWLHFSTAAAPLLLAACSAGGGGSGSLTGPAGTGVGAAPSSGASTSSGAEPSSLGGSLMLDQGGTSQGGNAADMGCAADSQEAHPLPTDLMLLLDQSGSMTLDGNRWDPTSSALKAFVSDPGSAGLGVGLQYFPLGATKTEDPAICQSSVYVMPGVAIAPLPDNASALTASIDAHHFTAAQGNDAAHWGTPTLPAVQGALQYLTTYESAHPDHRAYLLLATDGLPSKLCPNNSIDGIAMALAAAAAATPPIQTFVIGIGEVARLNTLADAGGTGHPAFIVDPAGTMTQAQLSVALDTIRHTALPCDYEIPKPAGGRIDPSQVNVELTSAGKQVTFAKVTGAAACANGDLTWYYDDESAPSKVVMCPSACDALKGGDGRIDIVFGCKTVTK